MEDYKNYIGLYNYAYRQMRDKAIEAMKMYGRELDFVKIGKKLLEEKHSEVYEEDIEDWKSEYLYSCIFEGKHEMLYNCLITKVRYNEVHKGLEVYLEDDTGYINDWFSMSWITFGDESVYMSILYFL